MSQLPSVPSSLYLSKADYPSSIVITARMVVHALTEGIAVLSGLFASHRTLLDVTQHWGGGTASTLTVRL